MQRRKFITLLSGAAATWPLVVRAQQAGKLPTVGVLVAGTPASHGKWVAAFVQRLRELGWIEGRSVAIEYRWAEGRTERFAEIAAEFVRLKVDVIFTSVTGAVIAAKQATSVTPIVFTTVTQSLAAWWRVYRDQAATSLACRNRLPGLGAKDLACCTRSSRVSAGLRS
jgi:putative ABC transport system substrate-binding protein